MRLRIRRLSLVNAEGAYELQAATEYAVGKLLEGRIQAALVYGKWGERGKVVGLYQPAIGGEDVIARRITGGGSVYSQPLDYYLSIVLPTSSLRSTVEIAQDLSKCLEMPFMGVTRFGPKVLTAGVIEFLGDIDFSRVFECSAIFARGPRINEEDIPQSEIESIARAYKQARWIYYSGASPLSMIGEVRRENFHVRVGVHLVEGRFISTARIDGNFYAAPPAEPFSTIASIQGMPLGEQVFLALEARFSSLVELYGITPEDIVSSLKKATGSHNEESSRRN